MANDKAFRVKNGLQAGRYLQSAGTETAGSVGYNLASASYDSVSFSVATQEDSPQGISFKTDGTKMYVVGGTRNVTEYNLSTAWDITTASFNQVFSVLTQDTTPTGLFFKPDGVKMYITGNDGNSIYEYSLSTAWDISTSSYIQSFSVSSEETSPTDVSFKSDGTKMYVCGTSSTDVIEYNLSTAWDVSTASFNQAFDVANQDASPQDLVFNLNGTKLYVLGAGGDAVYEYSLSTAWDISSASYASTSFSVSAQDIAPVGLFFKEDGTKMYFVGAITDTIYQYSTALLTQTLDLSTGTYFSFTPSGATTVSFTNPPASGLAIGFAVEINGDGSAITWPASVKWHEATAPTATATKEIYTFITTDGGTTYYGKKAAGELA